MLLNLKMKNKNYQLIFIANNFLGNRLGNNISHNLHNMNSAKIIPLKIQP